MLIAEGPIFWRRALRRGLLVALVGLAAACGTTPDQPQWKIVERHLPSALISVWGTTADDVWIVGSDSLDGKGPLVAHFDGTAWSRLATGQTAGDLWWVFGFPGGPIYMGGSGGTILRYQGGTFTKLTTPGTDTVFGIWGSSPTDVWAVGGTAGGASGAFAWRLSGDAWTVAPGFPSALASTDALWKVWGRSATDTWMVGTGGKVLRWDGAFSQSSTGTGESLFTVHANAKRFATVGGFGTGTILENDGSGWTNVSPSGAPSLIGICVNADDTGIAVGQFGGVYARSATGGWKAEQTGFNLDESLHAVWIDPDGGVWAVGGDVLISPLSNGILVHKGHDIPTGAL